MTQIAGCSTTAPRPAGRAGPTRGAPAPRQRPALAVLALATGALACGGRAEQGGEERGGEDRSRQCAGEDCSPGLPAITLEHFEWSSGEPPVVMAMVEQSACFLTRVGGRFDAAGDSVTIVAHDGQWLLGGSAASGGFVQAAAACVAAEGVTEEVSWVQGQEPIELYPADSHACFLTGAAGRFEGGAEVLSLTRSGSWYLSGSSQQPRLAGSARCVPMLATSEAFGMEFDTVSPLASPAEPDGACYLTVLCGSFGAEGDVVEVARSDSGWELRRQVGQGRSLRASAACFGRSGSPGE